jgi:hypothetical protein
MFKAQCISNVMLIMQLKRGISYTTWRHRIVCDFRLSFRQQGNPMLANSPHNNTPVKIIGVRLRNICLPFCRTENPVVSIRCRGNLFAHTMVRDVLLSGVLGAASGGAGTYMLHRALWKSSDEQACRIETLLPGDPASVSSRSRAAAAATAKAKVCLKFYVAQFLFIL